jgi:hypothetical protein
VAQTVPPDVNGVVSVTLGINQSFSGGGSLIDLGNAVRRRFFVDGNQTLQMQVWQVNAESNNNWTVTRTVPIASNVVAFKAQYGIAPVLPGPATTWMTPDSTMTPTDIINGLSATIPSARNIKVIRFGLIVKASEPDPALAGAPNYTETLFADCPAGWTCPCPSGVTCNDPTRGGINVNLPVSGTDVPYGWRYRKYETTVPLQNTIWN